MDELSREELVSKCKHYLALAQKAKQAKDEALKKVVDLEDKLKKSEDLGGEKTNEKNKSDSKNANVDILEAQLESCERRITRLSDENDKLLEALDTSEQKCKQLAEEAKKACKENEIAELKSQNKKLQEKLEEANATRKAVVKKLEEVSVETRQLIENSEQISDENELLKKQVTTLEDCKKNNEFEIEKLKENFAKITITNELMKEENSKLGETNDALKKQILEKTKEIDHLTSKSLELAQKTEFISALTSKVETLEKCNQSLQQELDNFSIESSNEKSLIKENECLRKKLHSASENISSLKQTLETLKGTTVDELNSLLSENEIRIKDVLDAKVYLSNIKDVKLNSLKQKVSDLRCKHREIAQENALLKVALSEKTALNEECIVDRNEISKTLENIKDEVSKLKCDKDRLELENGKLKEVSESLVKSEENLDKNNKECSELKQEKERLICENEDLKKKLDSLHSDFVKIQEKCNELDKKATDVNNQNTESLQIEISALTTENRELKNSVEKLKSFETNLTAKNANLCAKNEQLLNETQKLKEIEKQLRLDIQNLTIENNELKVKISDHESSANKLNKDINNKEEEHRHTINKLECEIRTLKDNNSQLMSLQVETLSQNEQLKNQENEILKLKEMVKENENVKEKLNECINLINELEVKNSKMELFANQAESADLSKKKFEAEVGVRRESAAVILKKVEEFQRLRRDLKDFMQTSFQDLSTFSSFVNQDILDKVNSLVENKDAVMKKNHAELLSEMQEMVTILKQRGEFISKLEQKLAEKNEEIKETSAAFTSRIEKLEEEISFLTTAVNSEKSSKSSLEETLAKTQKQFAEVLQELKSKHLIIDQLKSEISKLESSLKDKEEIISSNEQDLSRLRDLQENDTLSTSTISRTEEVNRLRDVEESFEDRYAKLKVVAVKLKKRCNDLTRQLETEKNKVTGDQSEMQQKIQQLTTKLKNMQCLQQELDKASDKVELYQNDLKSLQKKLDEEKHGKIKVMDDLETVRSELKEKVSEIENLLKEKIVLKTSLDSLSSQIETLQKEKKAAELVSQQKEKELNKMREKLVAKEKETITKSQQLEEAYGASKKQNILNLELQDYEKTVADLTQQLNVEKCQVKNLQDELQEALKIKSTLNDQISALETQISIERSKGNKLAENLSSTESKLSEVENLSRQYKNEITAITSNLEKEKRDREDLSLQLAEISSEFTKFKESSQIQHKSLVEQINNLTTQLDKAKKSLHESQEECETMKSEFQAYKIRVHSVLEKHKKENTNQKEEELVKIRLEQLEESNKSLKLQLDNISVELETAKFNLSKALSERETCEKSLKETRTTLTRKNKEFDEIKNELKAFKIKTDLLVSCHKSQVEEMKAKHETELQALKEKVTLLQTEVSKVENDTMKDSSDSLKQSSPDFEFSATREEGEGSENTDCTPTSFSVNHQRKQTIMPLDQLLEATDLNLEDEAVQIDELKHDLATYQLQVQHLSSLLNESEKNNARNEQLNSFLKEEIRRLERSLERQPHITNSEYLKNVIFKFVTLQSGDERSRLVPVLDTILKLSPDETKKLLAVASGNTEIPSGWNFLGW